MSHASAVKPKHEQVTMITEFVARSTGLRSHPGELNLVIEQKADGKTIQVPHADLDEVIARIDSDGNGFLQVNFADGKKILLTQNLVGFKPAPSRGLDLGKLPKVVEAIEDTLSTQPAQPEELEILKKVFESVLRGAEAVGFDTTAERVWMQGLARNAQPSA